MKVTLYSPDGTTMETIEAEDVVPVCSNSGFMGVVLESADAMEKLHGLGIPKRYFHTNLPMSVEGKPNEMRQPEPRDPSFTVKLINNSGEVIRTWNGTQGPYFLGKLFGFKVDGEWVQLSGHVIYEPE